MLKQNDMAARFFGIAAIFVGTTCLLVSASTQAPTSDEYGHFSAGISYWQYGDTHTFRVNPPLVRALTTAPAYFLLGVRLDHPPPPPNELERPEFGLGRQLFVKSPERFHTSLFLGRLVVVSMSLSTAILILNWAKTDSSSSGGVLAATLWLFQPQILAHGSLITGDVFCSGMMLFSLASFLSFCKQPSMYGAFKAGAVFAFALLAKFSALILLPIFAIIAMFYAFSMRQALGYFVVFAISALSTVGLPYRFAGTFTELGDYNFLSFAMSNIQSDLTSAFGACNCQFLLAVPAPTDLLLGIDRQQVDFERGMLSYAAGQRSASGWWWFYIYSMMVKLPLATWLAILIAFTIASLQRRTNEADLLAPFGVFLAIILITAMKDGFAQQHRYILVAYPFLFLWVGFTIAETSWKVNQSRISKKCCSLLSGLGVASIAFTVVASMTYAPHWLGAFNSAAGGNTSGFHCLFNDASDWGQEAYLVRDWIQAAPHQVYLSSSPAGHSVLAALGASFIDIPQTEKEMQRPCYLVISKSDFVIDNRLKAKLGNRTPKEFIGTSHIVYFLDAIQSD